MKRQRNPRGNDEGVALLLALLFIVLLTVLVVEYAYETQVDTSLVAANLRDYQAQVAAKSAVAMGVSILTADVMATQGENATGRRSTGSSSTRTGSGSSDDPSVGGAQYDSLDEAWAFGIPFQTLNNGIMQCTIDDEFGKINLNALIDSRRQEPNQTLEQAMRFLLEARGAEEDPTDAILDWIDSDDDPRPNGAETDYYQSLEIPYPCKNAPLGSVEELLLIRGITPEVFFGDPELDQLPLTELLTVHGQRNGRVNVNTAELETLTALGDAMGSPGLAELVLEERQRIPFQNNNDLETRGIISPQDSSGQQGSTRNNRPFTVASSSYRIHGDGIAGESRVRIEAFLTRDPNQGIDGIRLTDWKEIR
ncbi:MAG: type II secretion system minor pseudopilin GspK [Candidatus Hydrogenedentes bacterium]|nr:type II secretion system minor pseudopilin GspK [Candidatus Hydrogenedentota bacterium]